MKSLGFMGLMTLATVVQGAQPPTTGPQYWSTSPNLDCANVGSQVYQIPLASGGIGYVCVVSGTFVWLAAGGTATTSGTWSTTIRVAGPAFGAIGVDYQFYDPGGNNLSLDTTSPNGSSSGNDVTFALSANQPAEVAMLGATSDAPSHSSTATGSVYAQFYCPNATTCRTIIPQLLYSALPSIPWSLSVPIAWDGSEWTQWSAQGVDDGAGRRVSLVVYNAGSAASIYTVRVYDSSGTNVATGTTPVIVGFGTFGDLLSNVVKASLPQGLFKVLIDGGLNNSLVAVLQVNGASATTLQTGYDTAPSAR